MVYIYNEIILPTNEENGKDGQIRFLPSSQIKQIISFLTICKEQNIHRNAKIFTLGFLFVLPVLIFILAILMAFNIFYE